LNVLLQVNISGEASKSGLAPDDVATLSSAVAALPNLALRGLMAIPEPAAGGEPPAQSLRAMKHLFDELRQQHPQCDTLSLGMTADLEAAVAADSTMVRVGTAIFGERKRKAA
jgi:pyridoxal phosphate enzyme (YggS family)